MIKESLTSKEFEDVCKQIRALLNNDTVIMKVIIKLLDTNTSHYH